MSSSGSQSSAIKWQPDSTPVRFNLLLSASPGPEGASETVKISSLLEKYNRNQITPSQPVKAPIKDSGEYQILNDGTKTSKQNSKMLEELYSPGDSPKNQNYRTFDRTLGRPYGFAPSPIRFKTEDSAPL